MLNFRLGDVTLNACLHVKSSLASRNETCETYHISSHVVSKCYEARNNYNMRLQRQRLEEEEKRKEAERVNELKKRLEQAQRTEAETSTLTEKEASLKKNKELLQQREKLVYGYIFGLNINR